MILGADLAALYGIVTWRLNEQVKRNKARFPGDFVFQLTAEEDRALTSQFARSNPGEEEEGPCPMRSPNTEPLWQPWC